MGMRIGRALFVLALAVTASAVACRQLVGITDNPPMGPGETCGLADAGSACGECTITFCCSESTACTASAACAPYEACLSTCDGHPRCRAQCALENPVGTTSEVAALDTCLASHCESACGLSCGGIASVLSPPDAAVPCQACLVANACAAGQACAASLDCNTLVQCVLACTTDDCRQACTIGNDTGSALVGPIISTWVEACHAACARGADWECVGSVGYPIPTGAGKTKVTIEVTSEAEGTPVPGLNVAYCEGESLNCQYGATGSSQPAAQGHTNDAGLVTFEVPDDLDRTFLDYLDISSPSGSIAPTLYYFGFELTEPTFELITQPSPAFITSPAPTVTPSTLSTFYSLGTGSTQKPGTGTLVVVVTDCVVGAAAGVRIGTNLPPDAGSTTFYFGGTGGTTGPEGFAFILNLPPGTVAVTATPVSLGRASGSATVFVRAGAVTALALFPTPSP
jgi:hypothetical protein